MKTTKFIMAATLVTLGLSVSSTVSTAVTSLDSTGKVKVVEGTGGGNPGTIDPENPENNLPDPDPESPGENVNNDKGPLIIEYTTNLDFGTVETQTKEIKTFAKPMTFYNGEKVRGAYVQWADLRAGGVYGYTVSAKLSKQFTNASGETLENASIHFANGRIVPESGNTNIAPTTPGSFDLTYNTTEAVVTANEAEAQGKGRFIMSFGQAADNTADKSVELTIPAATASKMAADDYTATITWNIEATPTPLQ